jgi:hypothetical protein
MIITTLIFFACLRLLKAEDDDFKIKKSMKTSSCAAIFNVKTLNKLRNPTNLTGITYEDTMQMLNAAERIQEQSDSTFNSQSDLSSVEWVNLFAYFQAYSMCENATDIQKMALPNKDLVTPRKDGLLTSGNFTLHDFESFTAYQGSFHNSSDLDGRYIVSIKHDIKVIILSWRGSATRNDAFADGNGKLRGVNDIRFQHFSDNGSETDQCKTPTNQDDLFYFSGFILSMGQRVMNRVLVSLRDATTNYPDYSLVITGHSLGGAKALLTAFYISKLNPHELRERLVAIYTYGQPPIGSTKFSTWISNCIGSQKIVRVVSSNDLVPWARVAKNVEHPSNVAEVFNIRSSSNYWHECMGPNDRQCSAGVNCALRSWENHSLYGGLKFNKKICLYAQGTSQ